MPEFKIALLDGFAGGGKYQGGEAGSPFVLLTAVDEAESFINNSRASTAQIPLLGSPIDKLSSTNTVFLGTKLRMICELPENMSRRTRTGVNSSA